MSPGGEVVGKVVRETAEGYVVAFGAPLRRSYRVVPREHGWSSTERRLVLLVVPLAQLLASPPADRSGGVDPAAFRRYWRSLTSPTPRRR